MAQVGSPESSVQARQELERFARHLPADELEVVLLSRDQKALYLLRPSGCRGGRASVA
ncbi:hypothetical protein [Archangium lipolyticum]|uniref:hypothetical protein n=1 Tax=Archangium lipolyticum TaxID=2970465 RepID=UPI00214A4968|nr:hypothetical protein [Archangium lipolyticum]